MAVFPGVPVVSWRPQKRVLLGYPGPDFEKDEKPKEGRNQNSLLLGGLQNRLGGGQDPWPL